MKFGRFDVASDGQHNGVGVVEIDTIFSTQDDFFRYGGTIKQRIQCAFADEYSVQLVYFYTAN